MRDRSSGPVALERLQAETERREVALHARERGRRFTREQALARLITVDLSSDKIMCAKITCVDLQSGDNLRRIDEPGMTGALRRRAMGRQRNKGE